MSLNSLKWKVGALFWEEISKETSPLQEAAARKAGDPGSRTPVV